MVLYHSSTESDTMTIEEMLLYVDEYDQYEDIEIDDGGIEVPVGVESTCEMDYA
jgi:hypothetical protein